MGSISRMKESTDIVFASSVDVGADGST